MGTREICDDGGHDLTLRGVIAKWIPHSHQRARLLEIGVSNRMHAVNNRGIVALTLAVSTIGFVILMAIAINSPDSDGVLEGEWTVQAVVVDGAETPVAEGTTVTAIFDAGMLSGSAGCNNFTGGYETDGASLTIGPLGSTAMFCADPAEAMDQEATFLALLTEAESFAVDGDHLEIRTSDGSQVLLSSD